MARSSVAFDMSGDGPTRVPWAKTPGMLIAGQAAIDEVDTLATAMERKWGADRLRLLVGADLREPFDRQRYKLNRAVWHGELDEVRTEAARMCNAWRALDAAADANGAARLSPRVIETATSDGTVIAIVADGGSVDDVRTEGRKVVVWTIDEIASVLDSLALVNHCKAVFLGATVTRVRQTRSDVLDSIPDTRALLDDDVPF